MLFLIVLLISMIYFICITFHSDQWMRDFCYFIFPIRFVQCKIESDKKKQNKLKANENDQYSNDSYWAQGRTDEVNKCLVIVEFSSCLAPLGIPGLWAA